MADRSGTFETLLTSLDKNVGPRRVVKRAAVATTGRLNAAAVRMRMRARMAAAARPAR
jgi:hypothetical protein